MSAANCNRCGRFTGKDGVEICDSTYANAFDPDGWTDTYLCGACLHADDHATDDQHRDARVLDEALEAQGLLQGRMISASKSGYCEQYPDHDVFFNACIFIKERKRLKATYRQVWWGDLDLTLSRSALIAAADACGVDLYVTRESFRWEGYSGQKGDGVMFIKAHKGRAPYRRYRMGTLGFIRKDENDRWFFEPFDKIRIFRENLHDIECFIEYLEDGRPELYDLWAREDNEWRDAT